MISAASLLTLQLDRTLYLSRSLPAPFPPHKDSFKKKVEGYKKEVDGYKKEVDGYKKEMDGYKKKIVEMEKKLAELMESKVGWRAIQDLVVTGELVVPVLRLSPGQLSFHLLNIFCIRENIFTKQFSTHLQILGVEPLS